MMRVPIQANLIKLLSQIVDIVNLGLIPKKYIKEWISKIMQDTQNEGNGSFK